MLITFSAKDLLAALRHTKKALPAKNCKRPELFRAFLEWNAESKTVRLTTTDLDHWLTVEIPTDPKHVETGSLLVSHHALETAVKGTTGTVEITPVDEETIRVSTSCRSTNIPFYPVDEFSLKPTVEETAVFGCSLPNLAKTLLPFIAVDPERPKLQGSLINLEKGNKVEITASNGHYLVSIRKTIPTIRTGTAVIPGSAWNILKSWSAAPLSFIAIGEYAEFKEGNKTLIAKLIAENYPSYRQVIPLKKHNHYRISVDRANLLAAIKAVIASANDATHRIKFTFRPDSVDLYAHNMQSGKKAETSLTIDNPGGLNLAVSINGQYLIDASNAIPGQTMDLFFSDAPEAGILFEPSIQDKREKILVVIMPLRVDN